MNFLDIIILIPLVWCAIKGLKNGFIMEIVSFLALVAGVYLAMRFSYRVGEWIHLEGDYAQIISFVILFAIVAIGIILLGKGLSKLINKTALGIFNRLGGMVVSFGKAFVLLSVLVYFWNKIDPDENILESEVRDESLTFRLLEESTYRFWPIMKETLDTGAESWEMIRPKCEEEK